MRWLVRAGIALGAAALLWPASARANGHQPEQGVDGSAGLLRLPRATPLGAGFLGWGAWAGWERNDDAWSVNVAPTSVGMGLPYHLEAALSLDLVSPGDAAVGGGQRLQLHALLKRRMLAPRRHRLVLSAALRLEDLLSHPYLTPLALLDWLPRHHTVVVAAAGFRAATAEENGSAALIGLGLEHRPRNWLTVQAEGRWWIGANGQGGAGGAAVARFRMTRHLDLVTALEGGFEQEADLRLLIGIAARRASSGKEDSDGDGIPDDLDLCPESPEDKDGFEDSDGCPDVGHAPANADSSHLGPVLMRLRIPEQPVPTGIMRRTTNGHSSHGRDRGLLPLRLPVWLGKQTP